MKARIIVTRNCTRHCANCCNTFESVRSRIERLTDPHVLRDATSVSITGGEPLLEPQRTLALIQRLKSLEAVRGHGHNHQPLWLYTSIWRPELVQMLDGLSGVQFTLHPQPTADDFSALAAVTHALAVSPSRAFHYNRLKVVLPVDYRLDIVPMVWDEVRLRPFMTQEQLVALAPNGGVPDGEVLYELEGDPEDWR